MHEERSEGDDKWRPAYKRKPEGHVADPGYVEGVPRGPQ